MQDFTLQKIFEMVIPERKGEQITSARSDYLVVTVPGYRPDDCIVSIKPMIYANYDQGRGYTWGCTPTFVDLGGEQIGIVCYTNGQTYVNDRYSYTSSYNSVQSLLEVMRFRGR